MLEEEETRYTESHHIILCGDFNSRTGRAPDYDNNMNVLNERCNEDGVINKYGQSLLNFCINTELKIANGRMFDDKGIGPKMKKKFEYQACLWNEQTCIAFETMLCVAAEGCNSDNLCDIFNGMLENAISPLFLKKQHKSNSEKNIKNNFPSNSWYDKECKSLKHFWNNIA